MQNKEIYDNLKYYLTMDKIEFDKTIKTKAFDTLMKESKGYIDVSALLALTNICRNDCTYCGLGSSNHIKRFTLDEDSVLEAINFVADNNIKEIFFIGGENPNIKMESYIKYIKTAKNRGLKTNLAMGVFNKEEYKKLKDTGLDTYTIKFEESNPTLFESYKPNITFDKRMKAIHEVKDTGLQLASGSIVGLKGQTLDDVVNDIKLTVDLDVEWIPIVPYLPSHGTKMAEDTPPGDIELTLRAISLLRLMLPKCRITAAQPGLNKDLGFGDPEGNLEAIKHGANLLFAEVTPFALKKLFSITDHRELPRLQQIKELVEPLDLKVR
jgi:biotin synthase